MTTKAKTKTELQHQIEDFRQAAAEVVRSKDSAVAQVGDGLVMFIFDDKGVLRTEGLT